VLCLRDPDLRPRPRRSDTRQGGRLGLNPSKAPSQDWDAATRTRLAGLGHGARVCLGRRALRRRTGAGNELNLHRSSLTQVTYKSVQDPRGVEESALAVWPNVPAAGLEQKAETLEGVQDAALDAEGPAAPECAREQDEGAVGRVRDKTPWDGCGPHVARVCVHPGFAGGFTTSRIVI
jgi:hypothetical protein